MTMDAPSPPKDFLLSEDRTWDAVVVGAGPAGALVARELARRGRAVVLLDRQAFPRWKVCGACLSPGAQGVLRRAGVGALPQRLGAVPLRTLRLRGWSIHADIPLRGSLAISRSALDGALVDAAQGQGAVFSSGGRAYLDRVTPEEARVRVERTDGTFTLTARIVVAADGLRSGILAGSLGHQGVRAASTPSLGKVGLGAVFDGADQAYAPGEIHMAVGEGGYVGLVRTEDGKLSVAAAVRPSELRGRKSPGTLVAELLAQASFPPIAGEPLEGWRGTPNLAYHPPAPGGTRVFAVGDAAGYVEPFTGEGMSWALAGAWTLAPIADQAVAQWRGDHLAQWCRAYRDSVGRAQRICRGAAWTLNRPRLSRAALRVLHFLPQVADPLVRGIATPPAPANGSLS